MKLEIDSEKIVESAKECGDFGQHFRDRFKALFPEVFRPKEPEWELLSLANLRARVMGRDECRVYISIEGLDGQSIARLYPDGVWPSDSEKYRVTVDPMLDDGADAGKAFRIERRKDSP